MECNKDEALRAKEIAERKFFQKDLKGAKKFAQKAQTLYPQLDDVSQFLIVLEVHLMAESRVSGEKDWYAIMSLSPSADESTVKRHYRQLVLQLHPDKNHSPGAEGAFKLVQEAFDVLKDKHKRHIFDQKRRTHTANGHNLGSAGCSAQGTTQTAARPVPQQPKRSTASRGVNGARQTAARPVPQNTAWMGPRPSKPCTAEHHMPGATQRFEQPAPQPSEARNFWTRCTSCNMWFEHSLIYQNRLLLCPSCTTSYCAADTGQQPVSKYNFALMEDWKRDNSGFAERFNASTTSNQGSSENVSSGLKRPYKRMRGDGRSDMNGGSYEKTQRVGSEVFLFSDDFYLIR
ncbi:DnaJ subfamily B member 14 [Carex littledalei]|uniref:DnaJ subfamily B member 14 n=1 Tax=Carex littledalei TaxID=544730 RepID=A0A833VVG9_9POAL|nr:DnaJ subfamily B member 14 [Carex littledalei]